MQSQIKKIIELLAGDMLKNGSNKPITRWDVTKTIFQFAMLVYLIERSC